MKRKPAKKPKSLFQRIKSFVYPHEHNNHHPHAIRHSALAAYTVLLLAFNVGYNVFIAHTPQVLGFATSISQQEVIRLTNVERQKAGVPMVAENAQLNAAAMAKAQNMFKEDYWAHYSPSGISPWHWFDQAGYSYSIAGENLARDFDTSQGVINGWLNSPSHRENMLTANYQHIGIAVLNGVLNGSETTLVVQHFGTPVLAASNSPSPATQGSTNTPPPPAPTQTPSVITPTAPPVQEVAINQHTESPHLTGSAGIPAITPDVLAQMPYQLLNPTPVSSWSVQQSIVIGFLFCLMLLFIFDFAVIHKKSVARASSHSLLHAGMMAVAIVVVLYSTIGGVI